MYFRSLGKAKKAGVQYESQELCLNFDDETTESMLLHNGPVHRDLDASFSMADSGVENTSLHSPDHNKPGSSTGNSNGNGGANDQKREGEFKGKTTTKIHRSNSASTKSNATSAAPVRLLNVGEVPIMTSSPRLGHVDIGFKDDGSSVVVFKQQDSNSETESTTDVLDDKTASGEHGVHSDDMERIDETNISLETPIKDATTSENKRTEENRIEPTYSSSLTSHAELETGDNLQRDRASTVNFDEIGETNDEHEVTSF